MKRLDWQWSWSHPTINEYSIGILWTENMVSLSLLVGILTWYKKSWFE